VAKEKEKAVDAQLEREILKTHLSIDKTFSGDIMELENGRCLVSFVTTKEMKVDELGLVHGGFMFGAADFAAMAAVNDPNVVLAEATVKFLAPVEFGKVITFEATASHLATRTRDVKVVGMMGEIKVFEGVFKAVVLERHPLRLKLTD
jgi:acyl-coenzyme A thioesterase PaaI-like protein